MPLVVQSSRSGCGPLNLALFDLGMVPWAGLFKGRATGTSFGSLWEVPGRSLVRVSHQKIQKAIRKTSKFAQKMEPKLENNNGKLGTG